MAGVIDAMLPFHHVATNSNCNLGNFGIKFFSLARDIPCTATAYDYFLLLLWLVLFLTIGFLAKMFYDHLNEEVGLDRKEVVKSFLIVAIMIILAFFVIFESFEIYGKQKVIYTQTAIINQQNNQMSETAELLQEVRNELVAFRKVLDGGPVSAPVEKEVVVVEKKKEVVVEVEEEEEEQVNTTVFDYDNDGLSIDEEAAQGTSDYNDDSDADGLNDKDDPNPISPGKELELDFDFEYEGEDVSFTVEYNSDYYGFLANHPDNITAGDYFTPDDDTIEQIVEHLLDYADNQSIKYPYELVLAFYQSLDYVEDGDEGFDKDTQFPLQTLVEEEGDSEDLSLLLSSLMNAVGEHVILIYYDDHVSVGVDCFKCGGIFFEFDEDKYYYLEPVSEDARIGRIPTDYVGQNANILFLG
ncbi:hypothetical protein HN419_07645 [Candidatus Woesearchaeota archaeon]|jgi:hypothetical protein|nr:hypothetical protein [Candidatus Woesearchaeota archaeon]MBT3538364.1 hypothetical protein [Candidatus Woesearchaeota archaeon]MBT4698341.1 hypothetical protein [Candidatus Woesearchaeota archaeon]MBT4717162.1 hypothetical protein [Candidatus Woesearchaeota archaeon]MBT7106033.1 hypothetical protein [Candidatus Woesearchaeota archaeon]